MAQTYSQMLIRRPVMEEVIARLELDATPGGLASRVKTELVRDTQLIRLNVEDTRPGRAAQIANTIAQVFITQNQALQNERYADSLTSMREQIDELSALIQETQAELDALGEPETTGTTQGNPDRARLETILAGYRSTYSTLTQSYEQMRLTATQSANNLIILEPAQAPGSPVRPRTRTNTALAGVSGAMLAIGTAFLVEYLDDTVKSPEDVNRICGLGTMGGIGHLERGGGELVTHDQPLSPVSEAFRLLRTNIHFSGMDSPLRTLLVTSPNPLEGKTLVASNLAVVMAQAGHNVVVVEGDLRRPRLHRVFQVHPREGLTQSLLEGQADGRVQSTQVNGLRVLPSGELPPNPAEILGSKRMQALLGRLKEQANIVLIDSPPVLPVADAAVLGASVDGVLLVVEAGKTRQHEVRQSVESLRRVGANVIGVVLNAVPTSRGPYSHYHQTYSKRPERRNGRGRERQKEPSVSSSRKVSPNSSSPSVRKPKEPASMPTATPAPPSPSPSAESSSEPSRWGKWAIDEDEWMEGQRDGESRS